MAEVLRQCSREDSSGPLQKVPCTCEAGQGQVGPWVGGCLILCMQTSSQSPCPAPLLLHQHRVVSTWLPEVLPANWTQSAVLAPLWARGSPYLLCNLNLTTVSGILKGFNEVELVRNLAHCLAHGSSMINGVCFHSLPPSRLLPLPPSFLPSCPPFPLSSSHTLCVCPFRPPQAAFRTAVCNYFSMVYNVCGKFTSSHTSLKCC